MLRKILPGVVFAILLAVLWPNWFGVLLCPRAGKASHTRVKAHVLERALLQLEQDIGRELRRHEWPGLLIANPDSVSGWRGPYRRPDQLRDDWGREYAFAAGTGVYSFGPDGEDDAGEGDDIAPWR